MMQRNQFWALIDKNTEIKWIQLNPKTRVLSRNDIVIQRIVGTEHAILANG